MELKTYQKPAICYQEVRLRIVINGNRQTILSL